MILSRSAIFEAVNSKKIIIDPFVRGQLNTNSYNVSLGDELFTYDAPVLDMKKDNALTKIIIPDAGFILYPGVLYLARTREYTETKGYVPMIEGRSSVGRLGLFIHITAGFGDIGFAGYWTLELSVVKPVKIYKGVQIGQIYFHTVEGNSEVTYNGKYQRNEGVQGSMLYKDFEGN